MSIRRGEGIEGVTLTLVAQDLNLEPFTLLWKRERLSFLLFVALSDGKPDSTFLKAL
jgi:hypothetical protein